VSPIHDPLPGAAGQERKLEGPQSSQKGRTSPRIDASESLRPPVGEREPTGGESSEGLRVLYGVIEGREGPLRAPVEVVLADVVAGAGAAGSVSGEFSERTAPFSRER